MQSIGSSAPPGNKSASDFPRRPSWPSRPRTWLALCFAASGGINVVEALLPKPFEVLEWMAQYCPFHVSERSRVLLLAGGFLQLVLSRGLFRGKRAAWVLSLGLLVIIPFLHLGRAFDWHHAVLQSLLIIAFVVWRGDFCALSGRRLSNSLHGTGAILSMTLRCCPISRKRAAQLTLCGIVQFIAA